MVVSAIIPTKNRAQDVVSLLRSLSEQTRLPDEVIIIDQSPKPLLQERLEDTSFAGLFIRYYWKPEISGLTQAKNYGVSVSTGSVLLFLDDDVVLEKDFIEELARCLLVDDSLMGVSGVQVSEPRDLRQLARLFYSVIFRVGPFADPRPRCNMQQKSQLCVPSKILSGGITAYRRQVFETLSFDEVLTGYCLGEDVDFSYRCSQNHRLAICLSARAVHKRSPVGRYDLRVRYESKVASYSYFYKKNVHKCFVNFLAYAWLLVGLVLDSLITSAISRSTAPLRGLISGIWKSARGFEGIGFIRVDSA